MNEAFSSRSWNGGAVLPAALAVSEAEARFFMQEQPLPLEPGMLRGLHYQLQARTTRPSWCAGVAGEIF